MKLQNFAHNDWVSGTGDGQAVSSAVDGRTIAHLSTDGLDFSSMLDYARRVGGSNLRRYTFHERANMLKALAKDLNEHKKTFYAVSTDTGATRNDSWFDIDGGISTLFVYSSKGRREMPNDRVYLDGPPEMLSKKGSFVGQHIFVPRLGAAIHINAFNFPCWGMLEKLAPTILAGVPAIVKPASSTAYLTEAIVRRIVASNILPEGSVQLLCGSVGDLFEHLTSQDTVAFTGSKSTAERLQQHPQIIRQSVRFTAETDSLNAAILGPDAVPGTPEFDLFMGEVKREMISKAGQKCTAIRRIIAPSSLTADLIRSLTNELGKVRIGHPASPDVDMGTLASISQREEVRARIGELSTDAEVVYGNETEFEVRDADRRKGAFFMPTLLYCKRPLSSPSVHSVEAFGPVGTVMPYENLDEAVELAQLGDGSLVGSIVTNDDDVARKLVLETAGWHGRLLVLNRHCAAESTGHGSPLPHMVHGGPGRAGGGEELGGIRGVLHYMQRTALQGSPETLSRIGRRWIRGAAETVGDQHPFRKTFEQLEIGDTVHTDSRRITAKDIEQFADFTGDRFYAHMDPEAARKNPFFEGCVAHGYLIIAFAAGLFVEPEFGPVLANYGLDNLRFAQPVNPGDAIRIRLTCKQKTLRENAGYGEIRWDTEVSNQDGEIVASYDVLTMVATNEQWSAIRS